jgi:hypothetical protein
MIGDGGEIGEMKIGRGNRSTQRKPAPALLFPPQMARKLGAESNGQISENTPL